MQMPVMPWWAMLFFVLIMPLLQPITQYGSEKLQKTLTGTQQPQVQNMPNQPQPYVTYHNGQWWKYENNQWYVWTEKK